MQQNDSRNMIAFVALALIVLLGYQFFFLEPANKKRADELKAKAAIEKSIATARPSDPNAPVKMVPREQAKARSQRIEIDTPALKGSLRLEGARVDDIYLKGYRETLAKDSPLVELFRPAGAEHAWFADFGWSAENLTGLPGGSTVWAIAPGSPTVLTPKTPVTLTYAAEGLEFRRRIAVDDRFMFTVTDTVTNRTGAAVSLTPEARIQRQGLMPHHGKGQNVHEGAVGVLSDDGSGQELRLLKFKEWQKKAATAGEKAGEAGDKVGAQERVAATYQSTGGWLGLTDKYWLAAIVPAQSEKLTARYSVPQQQGFDLYRVSYEAAPRSIAAGATVTETTRLFIGAKVVQDLQAYQDGKHGGEKIPNFDKAVDWGMLFFFTRPFFMALELIFGFVGNFGLAILAVTLIVRIILFPLAHKSYESMSRMKKLQKPMEEIRAKYKEDPAKMQQETMALYQKEKVNPIAGCLPILLQIPIFLAFYKVLSVTIEMRHAPFITYIKDLSEPDPHTILNLFGLIPWNVANTPLIGGVDALVHLGPLPLLYGFTMWLTTAMNPPAPDPMQQRIFQLMPIIFTFIMAGFPAGLLLYWTFSNVFSIFQQYIIMHRLKVDNPIDDFIGRVTGRAKAVG